MKMQTKAVWGAVSLAILAQQAVASELPQQVPEIDSSGVFIALGLLTAVIVLARDKFSRK